MVQLTIEDVLREYEIEQEKNVVLSPGELSARGIQWTMKDAREWEEQIWKVYNRVREQTGLFITWFEAIEIYKKERDSLPGR
jgi:hypothetical protein